MNTIPITKTNYPKSTTALVFGSVLLGFFWTACYGPAQEITYLSNVEQTRFGFAVGNNSQVFQTGTATGGYMLNSVTLPMGQWVGYASNFVVSVYSDGDNSSGTRLCTLHGNSDPKIAGQYIYTAPTMAMNPATRYWIVTSCNQSGVPPPPQPPLFGYCWQFTASSSYASNDGWSVVPTGGSVGQGFYLQFAINATPLPVLQISLTPSNYAQLWFSAQANTGYAIECRDALRIGLWQTLIVVDPAPLLHTVTLADPLTPGKPMRFYRVRVN